MNRWIVRLALLAVFSMAGETMAQRYVDPRVSHAGYEKWCGHQGGTISHSSSVGGIGCVGARGHSSSLSYAPGAQMGSIMGQTLGQALTPVFYEFGRQIGCMLIGGCHDESAADEAEKRAKQLEQEVKAAQLERIRREEEARRRFQEAQERMLGQMRGLDPDGLRLRGFDEGALNVAPGRGLLGATELQPRAFTITPALSTQGRVRCAVSLLYKANKAYVDINTQAALWEAAYLSDEAAKIAGSASYRAKVECPRDPPAVGSVRDTPETELRLQRIRQSAIMFAHMQQLVADRETQKASLADAERKIEEAERKLKESERKLEEARTRLKREQVAVPPPAPVAVPPPVPATQPQGQDDAMLAEALEALKQAEEAKQSSREFLDKQRAQLDQMEQQLDNSTKELRQSMDGWANIDKSG